MPSKPLFQDGARQKAYLRSVVATVLFFWILTTASIVAAQDRVFSTDSTLQAVPILPADTISYEAEEVKPPRVFRHAFLFTMSFADDDNSPFLGGAYRFIAMPAWDMGLLLAFSARAGNTYTLEELRPRFYLQREEKFRGLVSLSIDKAQTIWRWLGVYAGGGLGYTWGAYEGTDVDPESKWTGVLDVGVTGRFPLDPGRFVLRLGYRYVDRVTSDTDTAYLAIGVGI